MRRLATAAILACLLVSACKVEPTPREYYDGRYAAGPDLESAQEAIRDRVDLMAARLERGDGADAFDDFATAAQARVEYGPLGGDGLRLEGTDVAVSVTPSANTGWFSAAFRALEADDEYLVTGVLVRWEGEWELVQLHASRVNPPSPPVRQVGVDG